MRIFLLIVYLPAGYTHPRSDVTDENCLGRAVCSIAASRARLWGAPAPSGMRSSVPPSRDHQRSVLMRRRKLDEDIAPANIEGHHEVALGLTHALCLNVAILHSCFQSSTS